LLNGLLAPARAVYRAHRIPVLVVGGVLALLFVYVRAEDADQFTRFTLIGLAGGCVYAIAASGLVLTYTTTGVFNFGHGAVGMLSAYVYWQLSVEWDLPQILAILIVLGVVVPVVSFLIELVFRRFTDAGPGTTIVLTIALMVLFIGIGDAVFPRGTARNLPLLFGDRTVRILGVNLTWDQLSHIIIAVAVALALRAVLYRSRTGVAMRAVVDNPNLAALNGAPPRTIARVSWLLGTELAAIAGILLASNTPLETIGLTFFVVDAYGAAVFGRLRSLPLTFAGAIVLGLLKSWSIFIFPDTLRWGAVSSSLPGIFLFATLLLLPQAKLTVGRVVGRRHPRVPSLRASLIYAVGFVGLAALATELIPKDSLTDVSLGIVFAVVLLSLVLLTGFSGQISLAQYVFVALGAWAMGHYFGGDSVFGVLVAGLIAVPIGALVALPALRLQGLYLALVTLAFARVANRLVLDDRSIYGSGSIFVGRPEVLGVSFDGDAAFLVFCSIWFAALSVVVLALRRGRFGRRLAAMRDSQAACATLGLDIRRTKLVVFCCSAFIAGVAGALFGAHAQTASAISFDPINNVVLFLFAVVGGITTVTGAAIGGALFALLPILQSSEYPDWAGGVAFAVVAAAAIGLGRQPNGIAGMIYEVLEPLRPKRSSTPRSAGPRTAGADVGEDGTAPQPVVAGASARSDAKEATVAQA
jgi:branched-chain amino acid transport system permease protein